MWRNYIPPPLKEGGGINVSKTHVVLKGLREFLIVIASILELIYFLLIVPKILNFTNLMKSVQYIHSDISQGFEV